MPADVNVEDLPDPVDTTVHTRRAPAETVGRQASVGMTTRSPSQPRPQSLSG
jgi:hypothetical protein